jgi:hypothetical protein
VSESLAGAVFNETFAFRRRHPLAMGSSMPIIALQVAQSSVLWLEGWIVWVVDFCSSSLPYKMLLLAGHCLLQRTKIKRNQR